MSSSTREANVTNEGRHSLKCGERRWLPRGIVVGGEELGPGHITSTKIAATDQQPPAFSVRQQRQFGVRGMRGEDTFGDVSAVEGTDFSRRHALRALGIVGACADVLAAIGEDNLIAAARRQLAHQLPLEKYGVEAKGEDEQVIPGANELVW